jgi:quinol monooxygenase YgiN
MTFIQTIELRTTNFDEIAKLEDEWRNATEGKRTLRRSIVLRDRAEPNHHLVIAFFDSHDSAMVNSDLPETTAFGEKQAALLEGPMHFTDYDVVDDRD